MLLLLFIIYYYLLLYRVIFVYDRETTHHSEKPHAQKVRLAEAVLNAIFFNLHEVGEVNRDKFGSPHCFRYFNAPRPYKYPPRMVKGYALLPY